MKEDQKEVLKAWIDGTTIQYQSTDGSWSDCSNFSECTRVDFLDSSIYRIKPKNIVTTTRITKDCVDNFHSTYSSDLSIHNLKLTWSPDGKTLIKAEVI